jgi:hypothetical protein
MAVTSKPVVKLTLQLPVQSTVKASEETTNIVKLLRDAGYSVKGFALVT